MYTFLIRFSIDFGPNLAPFEVHFGSEKVCVLLIFGVLFQICLRPWVAARNRDPCRPLSGQFLGLISMIYRKNRYGMSIPKQKHRVSSIGLALPKRHFAPASQTFLNVWARGWFRIGKYDTKSTSTTYACINAAPSILLALKAIKVDFISVFIERIDARLKRMLTIYRKTRYEMRVPMLKYRFLSIGLLLRRSILSLHLQMFNFS